MANWQATITGLDSETSYNIEVIASNASGDSEAALITGSTAEYSAPGQPNLVGSPTQTEYSVDFTPVPVDESPTGYKVYLLSDNTLLGQSSGGRLDTTIAVSGRVAGTTDEIYVVAYDAGGEGLASVTSSIYLAPADIVLSVDSTTVDSATLSYTGGDGAVRFEVYSDGVKFDDADVSIVGNQITVSGLVHSTIYPNVKVIGFNADDSANVESNTIAEGFTTAIVLLAPVISNITGTTFDVEFETKPDTVNYELYFDGVLGGTYATGTVSGVAFPAIQPYDVTYRIELGVGGYTTMSPATRVVPAAAPTWENVVPSDGLGNSDITPHLFPYTVSWSGVEGATSYDIEVSLDGLLDGNGGFLNPVYSFNGIAGLSYEIPDADGFIYGKRHYWHVRPVNVYGNGNWFTPANAFIVDVPAPVAVSPLEGATNISINGFVMDWTPDNAYTESPGEVAIIRVAPSVGFSFVALRKLPAGTIIKYTDKGWLAAGGFVTLPGESEGQYTLPADMESGDVVDVAFTGMGLSGEQLFLFAGDSASNDVAVVKFLYGVDWGNTQGWNADVTSASTSSLPSTLTSASISLGVGAAWHYSGSMSGSKEAVLDFINTDTNWTQASKVTWDLGNFSVFPVKWTDVEFEWRVGQGAFEIHNGDVTAFTGTYDGADLTVNDSYWWEVRGFTTLAPKTDPDEWSTRQNFSTLADAPDAFDILTPADATLVDCDPALVTFTWQASNADYYRLYVDELPAGSPSVYQVDTGESYSLALLPGTEYEWYVEAVNAVGGTMSTSTRTLRTKVEAPVLNTSTTVNNAASQTGGEAYVRWSIGDNTGVIGYRVKWGTTLGTYPDVSANIVGAGSTELLVTGLTNEAVYYFVVVAYDSNDDESLTSNVSNPVLVTDTIPPQTTSFSAASAVLGGAVDLTWVNPAEFNRLKIVRKEGEFALAGSEPENSPDASATTVFATSDSGITSYSDDGS
jgi:hypothetical protein